MQKKYDTAVSSSENQFPFQWTRLRLYVHVLVHAAQPAQVTVLDWSLRTNFAQWADFLQSCSDTELRIIIHIRLILQLIVEFWSKTAEINALTASVLTSSCPSADSVCMSEDILQGDPNISCVCEFTSK